MSKLFILRPSDSVPDLNFHVLQTKLHFSQRTNKKCINFFSLLPWKLSTEPPKKYFLNLFFRTFIFIIFRWLWILKWINMYIIGQFLSDLWTLLVRHIRKNKIYFYQFECQTRNSNLERNLQSILRVVGHLKLVLEHLFHSQYDLKTEKERKLYSSNTYVSFCVYYI